MTAPWSSQSIETATASHRLEWWVDLTGSDGTPLGRFPAVTVEVTHDEGWMPSVQGRIVLPADGLDDATLAAIDPRAGTAQAVVWAGYVHPGTLPEDADVHRIGTLLIVDSDEDEDDGTLTLDVESQDRQLLDLKVVQGGGWSHVLIINRVQAIISAAGISAAVIAGPGVATLEAGQDAWLAEVGDTVWSVISPWLDSARLRLYVDADGVWHLDKRPTLGATAMALRDGEGGTVVRSRRTVSRTDPGDGLGGGGWFSHVAILWRSSGGAGVVNLTFATAGAAGEWTTDPPTLPPPAGARVFAEERRGPISLAAARRIAETLVARLATRGRRSVVTTVPLFWLRPGMTVTIHRGDAPARRELIASVRFTLPGGATTITTRADVGAINVVSSGWIASVS